MADIDPFRIGMVAVGIAAAAVMAVKVLPSLLNVLWSFVPPILILALIVWTLKAMVDKLLS